MTRAETGLRRATVAFVCAVIIVGCIWLLGLLFSEIAPLPNAPAGVPDVPAAGTMP